MVREFRAETVDMKIYNNAKLLYMAVKQRTLKRSHASALEDKNDTIATVQRDSIETVDMESKFTKDVRVAMKNDNYNKKLAEDRKKKAYDMASHFQYLKDELEDSRDKVNYLQVEVVNIQGLKRYVVLRAGNLDR